MYGCWMRRLCIYAFLCFLPRVPLCACTFYLIMTDAAVRMCVTRESSREEEVREIRRED